MKAEYKNAKRSRRLIKEAYVNLLYRDEAKISISDIVKEADINRGTFYAHFSNTNEVLEQIENEILDKLKKIISQYKEHDVVANTKEILVELSAYIESDYDFFKKFLSSKNSEGFYKKTKAIFINTFIENNQISSEVKQTNQFKILVSFFAGGIISLYQDWFALELNGTLDEIGNELSKYVYAIHTLLLKDIKANG